MPRYRWILLVSQIWTTKLMADIQSPTNPRNCVIASSFSAPCTASAAMLSCCSMMAAPMDAKLMTSAMTFRCGDLLKEPERLTRADALLLAGRITDRLPGHDALAADDPDGHGRQQHHEGGARQQEVDRPEPGGAERHQRRSGEAAERRPSADEREEPLRLPRVVDQVGDRPELADEEQAEDHPEQVEDDGDPHGAGAQLGLDMEEEPEHDQQAPHGRLDDREPPLARQPGHQPRVARHQDPDHEPGGQQDVGQVVGPEVPDELRACQRLDRVPDGHRQERVGEHQEDGERLFAAHLHDRRQHPLDDGHGARKGKRCRN
jgi:hypothetical protein